MKQGIGYSGGWAGVIHKLYEDIPESGPETPKVRTICGHHIKVLPMSHRAKNDRECKVCFKADAS